MSADVLAIFDAFIETEARKSADLKREHDASSSFVGWRAEVDWDRCSEKMAECDTRAEAARELKALVQERLAAEVSADPARGAP